MRLRLSFLVLCLCLLHCKQDTKQQQKADVDLLYSINANFLNCEGVDTALLQEAMMSFERDITNFYTPDKPVYSRAYSLFVSQALTNKADYPKMVSDHSKNVFEALKKNEALWTTNPDGSRLNFQHPVFTCIGSQIKDEPLQKTFNALISTNSMSLRMFGDQLKRKTFGMKDDKYLATYVALELFYGKLFNIDFNNIATPEIDYEEASGLQEHNSHDGHNH